MLRRHLVAIALTPVIASCSVSADTTSAEQAVQKFHALLDSGNFNQIYEDSSEDLKQTASKKDFLEFLSAINRKLGTTKASDKQSWGVNYQTTSTFINLVYKTTFTEGVATEQFVFRLKEGSALLAGYHVSSMALITK